MTNRDHALKSSADHGSRAASEMPLKRDCGDVVRVVEKLLLDELARRREEAH